MFWRLPDHKQNEFLLYPYKIYRNNSIIGIVSSIFIHAGWDHLFFNMFSLYFLGIYLEDMLGPLHYLALYFLSALMASIFLILKYRNNAYYTALGASGAVSGVVFAFIALFPMAELQLFLLPFSFPAFVFGILYLIGSMYRAKYKNDNIAHEAHIGGAIMGIIYILLMRF
jgi:membrane associated rhomboid family serine protease